MKYFVSALTLLLAFAGLGQAHDYYRSRVVVRQSYVTPYVPFTNVVVQPVYAAPVVVQPVYAAPVVQYAQPVNDCGSCVQAVTAYPVQTYAAPVVQHYSAAFVNHHNFAVRQRVVVQRQRVQRVVNVQRVQRAANVNVRVRVRN